MILLGSSEKVLKTLEDNSVDSIVTDPPYGLSFMGKKWDYDVPSTELWIECLRVLKPGGYLLAFAGTRTQHRMAVRIEDAGFEIRDMIAWVYGSGFPKSLNIGKAVDKLQGNEREVADYIAPDGKKRWGGNSFSVGEPPDGRGINKATKGTSKWEGYGTALKPAVEPVGVYTKPLIAKQIIAIITDEIWQLLPANDVTNNLKSECTHLDQYLITVPELVKTNVLANIDNVRFAEQRNTLAGQHSTDQVSNKEDSVQEPVKASGKNSTREKPIQTGVAEDVSLTDISTSVLRGDISENTVLSWKNISEEILAPTNTLTTSTATRLITELKTLRLLLLQNTSTNIGNSTSTQPTVRPALEPITVARKPISEKNIAENVLKWGTGGINIDGSRVEASKNDKFGGGGLASKNAIFQGESKTPYQKGTGFRDDTAQGRFPANLILSYLEDEYTLKTDISDEQKKLALRWLYENA